MVSVATMATVSPCGSVLGLATFSSSGDTHEYRSGETLTEDDERYSRPDVRSGKANEPIEASGFGRVYTR
jgi:hypothetical protein